jgi:hypothetical protein
MAKVLAQKGLNKIILLFIGILIVITLGAVLVYKNTNNQVMESSSPKESTYFSSMDECRVKTKKNCTCMLTSIVTEECTGWGPIK